MIELEHERRRESRTDICRPCKVFHPRSGKYFRGDSINVATGGMLLRFPRTVNFEQGDRIQVGIAQHRRHALLRFDELMDAEVIRSARFAGETNVAVCFLERRPVSFLGHRSAA